MVPFCNYGHSYTSARLSNAKRLCFPVIRTPRDCSAALPRFSAGSRATYQAPMNANIETLTRFFVAIDRNDMDAITRDFAPAIVRIEPDGFPSAGTYCGIAEVQ